MHDCVVDAFPDRRDAGDTLPREPWSNAAGRYVTAVLVIFGSALIVNVVLEELAGSVDWRWPLGFALAMGAFNSWLERGTDAGRFRRRGAAPLALGSLATYFGLAWLTRDFQVAVPSPPLYLVLAVGGLAIVGGAAGSGRFTRQIARDPMHDAHTGR